MGISASIKFTPNITTCKICHKPIMEDEIPASTGPETFYHLHCLKQKGVTFLSKKD